MLFHVHSVVLNIYLFSENLFLNNSCVDLFVRMDLDSSSNRTCSGKKLPFTSAERELIVALVRERPVIEDKRTHAKNIELKKQAWEDLTQAFNSQPYVSQRVSHQLKRCWENIKTLRKKELSQESRSMIRTGGGPPESGPTVSSNNVIDTICPYINLEVPGVIDSNSIEISADISICSPENKENACKKVIDLSILDGANKKCPKRKLLNDDADSDIPSKKKCFTENVSTTPVSKKFTSETEARIKRSTLNIEQDQALHELRLQREQILIEREKNYLDFQKQFHYLQIEKIKLEIDMLKQQKEN